MTHTTITEFCVRVIILIDDYSLQKKDSGATSLRIKVVMTWLIYMDNIIVDKRF